MWLYRIKQTLHGFSNLRRHVMKLGMVDPVPSSIQGEGKVICGISVDFIIKLEEDAEAGVCKGGMCEFRKNVII
jgi:hypothetical protein